MTIRKYFKKQKFRHSQKDVRKLKVGGVGVSVGKEIGVSTPLGGVSVNLEEVAEKCNIQ
ncbi:MAG: hypothetical protein I3273_00485 [Candidatus Moeniiplasma glomeromycotorum]|nr:hypothetical protein [Candidatus Moeniiplasma glomeromycotorum]MCE8167397.1 hypothetical protein [Candidatus Moeniiplasma glomeromycotorum]MCE8168589.1 hypothetical protein [Candidatus Moeniiplasma glomeromycotorum]